MSEMITCHLREMADQLAGNDIHVSHILAKNDGVYAALDGAELAAKNAMCFHMGEHMTLNGFRIIPDLVRLPFSDCWFEFADTKTNESSLYGVLAHELDGESMWYVFCRPTGQKYWQLTAWATIYEKTIEGIKWKVFPKPIVGVYSDGIIEIFHIVSAFLSAMNCSNVRKVEHKPEPKIQRARAKRGKLPLFSFWTLELNLERSINGASGGGTHASPRLHLRRGHAREYSPGKWTWVQPSVVGNKHGGIVHKDYSIKQAAA